MAMTAEDKKWAAESDVRTLTEASQIKQDPLRLKSAKVAAARMVKEQQKAMKITGVIAQSSPPKKVAPKKVAPKKVAPKKVAPKKK